MPASKNGLLIGLVLCAGMLAGCSTTRLEPAISPLSELGADTVEVSQSSEYGITLPDEVAVVPSSFAEPTPGDDSVQLASLPRPEFPNQNPARDVFPEAPEARVPEGPAEDIVWAPQNTPRGEVDRLIAKYAALYEVPETLVRRVVKRESNFNPRARNGPYWGLMQILPQTAKGMGYQGTAQGLLDAETNLKYAVKYLRGAYMVAAGNHDRAVRFYASGYYYDAKRKGMLEETGLGRDRKRKRQSV
ncbi:lytic transglycosylase domain-containing protein [Mesorhizobium sp. KR9-304]|uniref:lytic transglycosylase domain-containing protein n=1 Tax=Mesorhizobium sp. KR9-304 TaxID=3156614 RepID=UPI0032B5E66B